MDEESLVEEAEAVSIIDIRQDPQYAAELIVRLATALREWAGLESPDSGREEG